MLFLLFILFVGLPIAETLVLIKVGAVIGAADTIGLVILSGFIGAYAVKTHGQRVFKDFEGQFKQGIDPSGVFAHAILIFTGGILMIAPGFITDLLGMSFIFPYTRSLHLKWLQAALKRGIKMGRVNIYSADGSGFNDFDTFSKGFPKNTNSSHSKDIPTLAQDAQVIDISTYRKNNQNRP